ncbi:uncharacterized protein LOC110019797 isoform X1 [Phalaenopsis equestris]|uniref:uncharacterized protein LOC110019797 isoform X1 n=1 Tax=Phalaenopsis equestris TaxID=78828 RepID=UPI0009E3E4D2|nr:uncharacterized protein LOC110019797 isoform X1 [Phalaenopsis equestris]
MEEMGPSFLEIAAAEVKENRMDSSGSACQAGEVKDADQCIEKLEAKGKSSVDDGIGEKCEGLGDVCMRGLEDNDVLKASKVVEVVSTENLEDDRIREESRGLCNASTEGDGCYGAEGFALEPMVDADKEERVKLGGHGMSSPVGGLLHKLDPSEVSKVKEASENSHLDPHMLVEETPPDAEIAAAAALISISSGDEILNEPAKRSSTSNTILPDSLTELVAEVTAGLDSSTGAPVKEKCSLVPLPDIVNGDPSDLKGNGIVEECNKDAEPSKHKYILDHHAFFERNPTSYTSELSDDSQPPHELSCLKSTNLSTKRKTRKVSPPRMDDRGLVKRRAIKRWTLLEENTLKEAVAEHGTGNWKLILFCNAEIFKGRTEVDLKDKWRNMSRYFLQA